MSSSAEGEAKPSRWNVLAITGAGKEIPKPQVGVRLLGIPEVGPMIQHAISQVLQKIWAPVYFDTSF